MESARKMTRSLEERGAAGAVLILLLVALASTTAAQTTFDYPGAAATGASGINDSGTIAGFYYNSDGSEHSFVRSGGTLTNIDFPGADWTEASGINQAGDVVGYYGYLTDNLMHGFLRTADGTFSTIDRPGRFNTMPEGINSSRTIVGCMHNMGTMHGWVSQNGTFLSLSSASAMYTGINDAGTIVGWYYAPPSSIRSFVLSGTGQVNFDYPGATNTQAYGVNAYGTVVGWYRQGGSSHGFLLHDSQFTSIDIPGATQTHALGINSAGTIVGYYLDASGTAHAFVQ